MKRYFTTSRYVEALKRRKGNVYECEGMDFGFYSTEKAAHADADWDEEYFRKQGISMKPEVLEVVFKKVGKKK